MVCMKHHTEKLIEKIYFNYDRVAAGPDVFTGFIRKLPSGLRWRSGQFVLAGGTLVKNSTLLSVGMATRWIDY